MFKLFNNNRKDEQTSSSTRELIDRWDSFLIKIENRFNDSLTHAEQACLEQLEETDYDYHTTFRTWQGIKSQMRDLIQKIEEVWQGQVEDEMREVGDFWVDERIKGTALKDKLHEKLNRFETQLEGEMSQKYYDHAIQSANQTFTCSQCNAILEIQKDLFRAQYVTCHYCNALNTFEPETKFTQIGGTIVNNIVALKCLNEYDIMQNLTNAFNTERYGDSKEYLKKYKKAYFDYYEKFFKERIKLQPDLEKRYEEDMERKRKEYATYEQQIG